jgi:amidase
MARTVADAAALLGAMAGVDPKDPATEAGRGRFETDYLKFLDKDGLRGVKLGVPRRLFQGRARRPQAAEVLEVFESALKIVQSLGAVLVDPADIPNAEGLGRHEMEVLLHEFKEDLNAYLAAREGIPIRTLKDLIEFNEKNKEKEMPHFGQELLTLAQEKGGLEAEAYRKALEAARRLSREEGVDRALAEHQVEAFVAPTGGPAWKIDWSAGDRFLLGSSKPAAVSGYPSVTVPAGQVKGLPVGISFFGGAWTEGKLLRMAYAFEQKAGARRAPTMQARYPE